MKLIIDIPESDYKLICNNKEDTITAYDTCRRIAKGTPLYYTIEDRISRLEKIIIALEPCIPESRYANECGLKPDDVIEAKKLLEEIKGE